MTRTQRTPRNDRAVRFRYRRHYVCLSFTLFLSGSVYKDREEAQSFLIVASSYIALNLVILFFISLVWLVREI